MNDRYGIELLFMGPCIGILDKKALGRRGSLGWRFGILALRAQVKDYQPTRKTTLEDSLVQVGTKHCVSGSKHVCHIVRESL